MQKKGFFLIFFILLISSLAIFKFKITIKPLEKIFSPVGSFTQDLFNVPKNIFTLDELKKLKEENNVLVKKIINQEELKKENSALKDQFKTGGILSANLLPAKIIGAPSFIPGVSNPEHLVLDKGKKQGVKAGQAVIFKDNLIGKIGEVSENISTVHLIYEKDSSFSVKTLKTDALGVLKGQGNGEMVLDNVLLSENLEKTDFVLTKGDLDSQGIGFPSDLIVGKIESIDKKPSSLFQLAKIKNVIDFSRLEVVFVIISY